MTKSPYLSDSNRLADVIAAIQVMGAYKFYKLDVAGWSDRICAQAGQVKYWEKVFAQHPEFFRFDSSRKKVSLVWRRQRPKGFNVDTEELMTNAQFKALPSEQKERISRQPLSSDEIHSLIRTAIDIHSKAIELSQERRWWVPVVVSLVSVLVGLVAGQML